MHSVLNIEYCSNPQIIEKYKYLPLKNMIQAYLDISNWKERCTERGYYWYLEIFDWKPVFIRQSKYFYCFQFLIKKRESKGNFNVWENQMNSTSSDCFHFIFNFNWLRKSGKHHHHHGSKSLHLVKFLNIEYQIVD